MPGPGDAPLSDEELLALLQEVEGRAEEVQDAAREVAAPEERALPEPDREGDPCPHCGEPALALDTCGVCVEEGCLPRDDWMPGFEDPCLTRCARCGNLVHVTCAYVNEAGNTVCCGPRAADDYEPYGP